jgi:hypothetical protein
MLRERAPLARTPNGIRKDGIPQPSDYATVMPVTQLRGTAPGPRGEGASLGDGV